MRLNRAARIRWTVHSSGGGGGGGGGAQGEGNNASLPSTAAWHGGSMCFAVSRLHYPKMLF